MFGFWKTWKALEARGIMGINRRNADYVLKYNKRSLYPIVDDKILTKERAIAAGIHVPELYGVISTEKEIDKPYKEEVKNASQALRTPQDWKAYLKKFVAAEVAYVERRFDEEMKQLAKVAAKLMPDVISEQTLSDVEACALYLKEFPVKFRYNNSSSATAAMSLV